MKNVRFSLQVYVIMVIFSFAFYNSSKNKKLIKRLAF